MNELNRHTLKLSLAFAIGCACSLGVPFWFYIATGSLSYFADLIYLGPLWVSVYTNLRLTQHVTRQSRRMKVISSHALFWKSLATLRDEKLRTPHDN